jgi:sugar phosphate isomerase/epimerase
MRNRFSLNTATIKQLPLAQQIRLASATGFHGIGLWLDDIEAATSMGIPLDGIARWVDEAGLKVEEVCFLGGWQDALRAEFPAVLEKTRHICRISRALGCDVVVAVPALQSDTLEFAPARLREVCDAAAEHRVRIALEFPGIAAEVKDVVTAWWLVSTVGRENAGLVLDSFHFFLGGSKIEDLMRIPVAKIFLVHLSDALNVPLETLRTPHDFRTFPGEGTLDYRPFLKALQEMDYQGAFSLEIWNRQLKEADAAEVARKGFASLLKLEELVGSPQTAERLRLQETTRR